MDYSIKKVAVLGAGVMGQGIAAHLANAGIPSVLFDIVPKDASDRSQLAIAGIKNASKLRPAAFYKVDNAALITPANYEDDTELLKECDLIIEVVIENLNIKRKVFQWIAQHRRPGSIVTSNTSGISLAAMTQGMPEEMRQHFLVTHFFNPVRYMRLLELVNAEETLPEVSAAVARFGEKVLGKGIVFGKDTPNFVANRIGVYGIASVFRHMDRLGLTVAEVDAIFGPAMGRPKSAVFRTADMVGLDTLVHVFGNVYDGCPDDEERDTFVAPTWLQTMIDQGILGEKSGFGFYKKTKQGGKRVIMARDLTTGEYAPKAKIRMASIGKARGHEDPGKKIKAMVYAKDKGAELAWECTADTLIYTANRLPEIADDIVNIDRAMAWGFAWDLGPFQTWDAIGVKKSVARMEKEGRTVPTWVKDMLAAGRKSFYARDADARMTYWDPLAGEARLVPMSDSWLMVKDIRAKKSNILKRKPTASLLDIGDDVLLLQFHGKMNVIDTDVIGLYEDAMDELEAGTRTGLVVGNQGGKAFCAGANIFMVRMAATFGQWDMLEDMVSRLQKVLQRAKYSSRPVVTAPWGLTLGGGAEITMQSSHTIASGELYMGLVEVGVGVIPAGGGCKEMLTRYLGDIPEGTEYDPNPFVQAAYKNIALAKVATSAEEARAIGYLRPTDRLTLDPDALIHDAKQAVLGLTMAGYKPPKPRKFMLPGPSGRTAIELFLYQMHEAGWATDHDMVVGKKLAYVMTGGDIPNKTWVAEEQILELEREAFLSLCGTEATQARIEHMLSTGRPLRN